MMMSSEEVRIIELLVYAIGILLGFVIADHMMTGGKSK